jgi:hypothetical protein
MRAYQLMIMRLLLLQQHQTHDHEPKSAVALRKAERAAARGKEGR